ncbi:uncharacterized protein LOC114523183 [Dendronephthya gigantea]|uniref:uncharacterized protein LOC114523183 n=1 Tax=Dendronephthya gigantea TaxID=151771 RepID=UPI00106CC8B9|nr:uncharacterized protein LOC114523183 [Dendronephthya gigantea]XP_028399848.1 uncharacterized protein LOC114523183 [Dendronephthya gigantea]
MADALLIAKKDDLQLKIGTFPVLLLETFQNWGMTQKMTVISVKPKTVKEVEDILGAVISYNAELRNGRKLSLRCVGDGHSWSPLFPDEGNILMYTSNLVLKSHQRIRLNQVEIGTQNPLTITMAPGVTTGELSKFFTENNVCFNTDVILDKVTYGGVIAPGCHGVGKDQLAVSDYVTGMSIVGANGKESEYTFPSGNPDHDNALKCNMGLFGVMTSITMEVQPMTIVKVENDFSYTVKDLFYKPAALEKLYKENWSLEIFWFPFNSMPGHALLYLFTIGRVFHCKLLWNPKKDKLWIRKINPVEVPDKPTKNEVEYSIKDAQDLRSAGFGRKYAPLLSKDKFLVPSFLKAGFKMVKKSNSTTCYEHMNKAIHYQGSIEIMPVLDMEFAFNADPGTFSEQVKAMQAAIDVTKDYYDDKKFPLSVAMEMRWMAYSDCLICPANGVHKNNGRLDKKTLYLEVLGLAGTQNWEDYTNDVAAKWMDLKINGMSPLPHWAKQWSYVKGIDEHIQTGYGENLTKFRDQVPEPERLLFSNEMLNRVIFSDSCVKKAKRRKVEKRQVRKKLPKTNSVLKDWENILEDLKEHEETWETFFMRLAENVWNVPSKAPEMDVQKEWENTSAIFGEINKKYPQFSIAEELYKDLFT